MDPAEDEILTVLTTVIDPELGINIVDLGLIYEVEVQPDAVSISMTMTTAACPLAPHLMDQVNAAMRQNFPALRSIDVQLVWEPAWDPLMMSWKAKDALGWG